MGLAPAPAPAFGVKLGKPGLAPEVAPGLAVASAELALVGKDWGVSYMLLSSAASLRVERL